MQVLKQVITQNIVSIGDSLAVLKELDSETIGLTITSLPYFQ